MDSFIRLILRHRRLVLLAAPLAVALGVWGLVGIPFDVVPDISPVQAQILTPVAALAPDEAELAVTRTIELAMQGLPDLENIRSVTTPGVSSVVLTFHDGADSYRARQLISERLSALADRLPRGLQPRLAPMTTGLGEIFTYALTSDRGGDPKQQLTRLKTVQDFIVRPALRAVPGLADINTTGGYDRALVIEPSSKTLAAQGMALNELVPLLENNFGIGGGGITEVNGDALGVRSHARVQTAEDVENLDLRLNFGDVVQPLKSVATVSEDARVRLGAATYNGNEAVLGIALALPGADSWKVGRAFRDAIAGISTRLPDGVKIVPLYDRSALTAGAFRTVSGNLVEGAALVIAVLFLLLGDLRASLIVASVIPLAFLLAMAGMRLFGISGNLMSLGAIDFGLLVDGAVVLVDNMVRNLPRAGPGRLETFAVAFSEVWRPIIAGCAIILLVYAPLFGLSGIEGKMFRPMAAVICLCLGAALLLSISAIPAMAALFLKGSRGEPPVLRFAKRIYLPALDFVLAHRGFAGAVSILLCASAAFFATRLGADFLPKLDEGWLVVETQRNPNTSLNAAMAAECAAEKALLAAVPEVDHLYSRIGCSDLATDPQLPSQNDLYIAFRPREQWRSGLTKVELVNRIMDVLRKAEPGADLATNQPIAVRFDEMLQGIRTNLAIKVFGPDFNTVDETAHHIEQRVATIPGADDVALENTERARSLDFFPNRVQMQRYFVTANSVNDTISTALMGREVGRVDDGEQFHPIVLRLPEADRTNADSIRDLAVRSSAGILVELRQIGDWKYVDHPPEITRENGERRRLISVSVRGGDVAGVARRVREAIAKLGSLPPGVRVEIGGSVRELNSATRRLAILVPFLLLAMAAILYLALGSARQAFLVCAGIPLSIAGGIFALTARGMPFTISAGAGFIAVSGIAMFNGLILLTFYNQRREAGLSPRVAIRDSALARLRPELMTSLVATLGFLPMALASGPGAEIQRPLATVVIGGLLFAIIRTLLVIPVILGRAGKPNQAEAEISFKSARVVS